MVRKILIFKIIFFIFFCLSYKVLALPIDEVINEKKEFSSAIIAISVKDANSGNVLYEKNEEIIENETAVTLEEFVEVNENEQRVIDSMLKSYFGEKDETTGNEYIFEIVGKKDEGYFGRWKWLVEDHSSLLTEFIITSDMAEMYECDFGEDGEISWLSESNLFEN